MSSSKKLVIFDLDGVLVDACDWHRDALNEALLEVSNTSIEEKEHVSTFNGIPTRKKLEILIDQKRVKESDLERIYDLKQEKTIQIIQQKAQKRKEKIELITELKRRGFVVACFTNSIRETANLMLSKTGVLDLFELVVTNQDVSNPKPDPEGYVKVMKHFRASKEETCIIEDSPKGIEAAEQSGAQVIVVKNPDDVNLSLIERIL
jgi:beta-phosphoglucomutase